MICTSRDGCFDVGLDVPPPGVSDSVLLPLVVWVVVGWGVASIWWSRDVCPGRWGVAFLIVLRLFYGWLFLGFSYYR